jgi:hypothetical protein
MASRTFEVYYKIVITWDSHDRDENSDWLNKLNDGDALAMAEEMREIGVAKYKYVEVKEV